MPSVTNLDRCVNRINEKERLIPSRQPPSFIRSTLRRLSSPALLASNVDDYAKLFTSHYSTSCLLTPSAVAISGANLTRSINGLLTSVVELSGVKLPVGLVPRLAVQNKLLGLPVWYFNDITAQQTASIHELYTTFCKILHSNETISV